MTTTEGPAVERRVRPTPAAARDLIRATLDRDAYLTLVGRCTVEYDGRAASTLGPGDRHVTLKPDGTALVHTDEGQQPVNWQPPGCEHSVAVADGRLVVESERSNPAEHLRVAFDAIASVAAFDLADPEDLSVTGTEDDLRGRLLEDPALLEEGFTPLATERQTPAGAVDVFGEDADGRTVVVELKRRRAGPDAVGQLARYVAAMERDLHQAASVRGVLVAPSVTDRARDLLARRGMEFVALEPTPTESADSADGSGSHERPDSADGSSPRESAEDRAAATDGGGPAADSEDGGNPATDSEDGGSPAVDPEND